MIANISVRGKKLFPRSQLPNSDGFKALAYNAAGEKFRIEVVKGADGMHRVEGCVFSEIIGWTNCVGGEE